MSQPPPQQTQQPVSSAPKRDKFAALTAGSANRVQLQSGTPNHPRRDKFAAVVQQQQRIVDENLSQTERLHQRCIQRDSVWKDIDRAEANITKLLRLASQTALALSQQAGGSTSIDLSEIQRQYSETLQEIHRLLSPHADLVQAYKAPSRVNQMYLERVEHRIAVSKTVLMKELLKQSGITLPDSDAVGGEEQLVEANEKKRKLDQSS